MRGLIPQKSLLSRGQFRNETFFPLSLSLSHIRKYLTHEFSFALVQVGIYVSEFIIAFIQPGMNIILPSLFPKVHFTLVNGPPQPWSRFAFVETIFLRRKQINKPYFIWSDKGWKSEKKFDGFPTYLSLIFLSLSPLVLLCFNKLCPRFRQLSSNSQSRKERRWKADG